MLDRDLILDRDQGADRRTCRFGWRRRGQADIEAWWERIEELATGENVADKFKPTELASLSQLILEGYEIDKDSRKDWETIVRRGLQILSAIPEKKNTPFEGASNVHFPLLQDALVQFWARCCSAILQDKQVVKAQVIGPDTTGEKRKRADRISEHMSYQKTEASATWVEDTRALIMQVGASGHAFRKCYWARDKDNPEADFCQALDVYVNNTAQSLDACPRITYRHQLYPYEVETRMRDGRFRRVQLDDSAERQKQKPFWFLEQMLRYDADGDGYEEPWIVTVEEQSREVVKVLANFRPEDITREMVPVPMPVVDPMTGGPAIDPMTGEPATQMQELPIGDVLKVDGADYWVDFGLIPPADGTYYKHGLAKLLADMQDAIDTSINQLTDAATLQNSGGGFIGASLKLNERGGVIRRKPGTYQVVNAAGQDIRNAIYNFEDPGPSQALFNMLSLFIETGKGTAMLSDVLTGEAPTQQPATTTLALIEQGLQVFGEIFRGLWESMRKEFRLQAELNFRYLSDDAYRMVVDDQTASVKADYALEDCDVRPVADPRQVTNMQKMARAQFLREHAGAPGINTEEIFRRGFEAAGIEDIDKLFAPPDPMQIQAMKLELARLAAEVAEKLASALQKRAAAVKGIADAEAAEAGANVVEYAGLLQLVTQLFAVTNPGMMNGQAAQGQPGQPGGVGGIPGASGMGMAAGGAPGQRGRAAAGMGIPQLGGGPSQPNGGGGAYPSSGGGGQGGPAF